MEMVPLANVPTGSHSERHLWSIHGSEVLSLSVLETYHT